MRKTLCNVSPLFNKEQVQNINKVISNNLTQNNDNPSNNAIKNSQVKFVRMLPIQSLILPFIDFIFSVNNHYYGFDLFQLTGSKILNYNTYNIGEKYTWHIDADMNSPIKDIKLTCLLNLSEDTYQGGDLFLFRNKEIRVEKFDPGSVVVFPSFIDHRVEEITAGKRNTLAIWIEGPKFR